MHWLKIQICFALNFFISNVYVVRINKLQVPDYQSEWVLLKSQDRPGSRIELDHGLYEMPILVDVQVKALEGPNANFIFPAIGSMPRDDDFPEDYGGVVYVYNDRKVIVSAPIVNNQNPTGKSIYVGNGTYFRGPNNQSSHEVIVRVRAWRPSSLPKPDFQSVGVQIDTKLNVYKEINHGLKEYPALLKVRTKLLDGDLVGWMSDSIGSTIAVYETSKNTLNNYVVYGFNKENVRIWASSRNTDFIFGGNDGYDITKTSSTSGKLEIVAWKNGTLAPDIHSMSQLGPNNRNESFEVTLINSRSYAFVSVLIQAISGANVGYRFPGSGSLAYVTTQQNAVCSYGGLVFAYSTYNVRFWRPASNSTGGVICVASSFGDGSRAQRDVNADVVVHGWIAWMKETNTKPYDEMRDIQNTCVHRRKLPQT